MKIILDGFTDDQANAMKQKIADHLAPMLDVRCEWFARCRNQATQTEPHPILGDVPICDRCAKKLESM